MSWKSFFYKWLYFLPLRSFCSYVALGDRRSPRGRRAFALLVSASGSKPPRSAAGSFRQASETSANLQKEISVASRPPTRFASQTPCFRLVSFALLGSRRFRLSSSLVGEPPRPRFARTYGVSPLPLRACDYVLSRRRFHAVLPFSEFPKQHSYYVAPTFCG